MRLIGFLSKIFQDLLKNRWNIEVYSVAGEMGFGWWLVEHYLSYHVDCPDGCVSGEPAGGG